ncbi:hypothetical protein [Caulobacter sp. UC70_42]|uniref:hypothetical protein n=1 Tax=Caulobacter sp. UC70_42 TaxID=3374551 RepID=UPI00375680E7
MVLEIACTTVAAEGVRGAVFTLPRTKVEAPTDAAQRARTRQTHERLIDGGARSQMQQLLGAKRRPFGRGFGVGEDMICERGHDSLLVRKYHIFSDKRKTGAPREDPPRLNPPDKTAPSAS